MPPVSAFQNTVRTIEGFDIRVVRLSLSGWCGCPSPSSGLKTGLQHARVAAAVRSQAFHCPRNVDRRSWPGAAEPSGRETLTSVSPYWRR